MSRTSVNFQFGEAKPQPARQRNDRNSFRMVVVGDLTGRASRGVHEPQKLSGRRVIPVDIDNFDDVLTRFSPELHIPLSVEGEGVAVTIRSLDDFHPDALFDRLELFASLRASRRRLLDPAQFADESARWRTGPATATRPDTKAAPQPVAVPASNAELLSQMLGQPSSDVSASSRPSSVKIAGIDVARLIDEAVAPYVLPKTDPRQAEFVAAVDEAAAELLRRLLHATAFQATEAAWRQLWRVTKAVTGDGSIRLFVLDATRAELAADFAAAGDAINQAGLYQALVGKYVETAGGEPWDALVALERFGRSAVDCSLLASLGALAGAAGGRFLADASPDVVGLTNWSQAADTDNWRLDNAEAEQRWSALRSSPAATSVGLAAPRPLVRLPYGPMNSATRLAFNELDPNHPRESFLWGYAALGCAELIGQAFQREGWSFRLGQQSDLDDLPAYVYEEDGEKLLQPCAETFMTVRAGELLADRGVIPLLSYANRPCARVMRFGSLSHPPTPLFP